MKKPINWNEIMKILNIILILTLVIVPTVFAVQKISGAGIVIFVVVIALFFTNLDKFEVFKFKAFELEAKLRTTINEAYAALDELKELALALSEPMIVNLAMSGQMLTYINLEYKLESVDKIAGVLRKLKASEQEVDEACGFIYARVRKDLYRRILGNIKPENWQSSEIYKGFPEWDFSEWNKERIEKFARENSLEFTPEAKEWMMDLEHFMKTKKLRRPEQWQS